MYTRDDLDELKDDSSRKYGLAYCAFMEEEDEDDGDGLELYEAMREQRREYYRAQMG